LDLHRVLNPTQPITIQGDREIFVEDIEHIRLILKRFPSLSRKEIVHTLCETLDWLTPAGRPKVSACTKLLHRLEVQGSIRLPAKREQYSHRTNTEVSTPVLSSRTAAQPLFKISLKALGSVRLVPLSNKADRALWNEYVERYHYLGYKRPFGYRQRYFIEAEQHRLGCVLLSGASKALGARDRWIGWDDRQRMKNLPWVLNNNRFLLFPWVQVPNLASHVLGQLARRAGDDWQQRWGYRPVPLETFVDPLRFQGSCYRAAGWKRLGHTTGEGLVRAGKQYQTRPKLIFAKPLQADFRRLLCSDQLKGRTEL
jgi:hypothetical protein